MKTFKFILIICTIFLVSSSYGHNKYSKEANSKPKKVAEPAEDDMDFRPHYLNHLHKPFRMAKLNLLWSKAVLRLSEPKLKSLLGDLKLHDKEEMTWKHLRAEGKDKDGFKEAELRKKLIEIMKNFDLLDQANDVHNPDKVRGHKALNEASDKHINKSLFKDKKLNKLWEKAESAGFTLEELTALKEEFEHHQDKIDQYYSLLHDVKNGTDEEHENSIDEKLDRFNQIQIDEETPKKDYLDRVNLLREHHRTIKDGYDHLNILAAKGPSSKEFIEPKVQGLWRIALESKFTPDELESLRVELLHYENRLLKLRHLQAEAVINEDKHNKKMAMSGNKPHGQVLMEDTIKKHSRKVEKIHLDIETRIMQKHIEL